MTTVGYPGQTWPNGPAKGITYIYDGEMLVQVNDQLQSASAIYVFTYDSSFRRLSEEQVGGHKITYTYDPIVTSKVKTYTITPPTGSSDRTTTVTYQQGVFGPSSMTWSGVTGSFDIAYDSVGRYDAITFPNGQVRDFTYDDQGRLTEVWNRKSGGGTIARFTYAYDYDWATGTNTMLGQRSSVNVVADVDAHQATGTTKYHYDAGYQLTRTDYPDGQWQKWFYDGIGNRTRIEDGSGSTTTSSFDYTYHRYPANPNADSQRVKNYGNGDVTYDANGNAASTNSGALTWDVANRLLGSGGQSYTYDYSGRRVSRMFPQTTYLCEGQNLIRQRSPQVLDDFIFGPGIDEPLARRDIGGNVTYYSVDGLGSVVAETNPAGAFVTAARYSPWGEAQFGQGDPFGYTGREQGPPGLFYRARYYEPTAGRFLSEDPMRFSMGPNFYAYAHNNPIILKDPFGLGDLVPIRPNPNPPRPFPNCWPDVRDFEPYGQPRPPTPIFNGVTKGVTTLILAAINIVVWNCVVAEAYCASQSDYCDCMQYANPSGYCKDIFGGCRRPYPPPNPPPSPPCGTCPIQK